MTPRLTIRQRIARRRLLEDKSGSTLVEWMLILPVLFLIVAYAVNFGFCFIAAADITSSARNAAQYSVLGYEGPAQSPEPVAGPASTTNSVVAIALADLTSFVQSSTTTTVQVCSKVNGMNTTNANIPKCSSYGPTGTTYTPTADPEAPRFVLQRVDVTYTVQPPIPMTFFGVSLMPNLNFHRQVSMRSMD